MRLPSTSGTPVLALAFSLGGFLSTTATAAEDDPRVEWLSEHAVSLNSIDPDDVDFEDLEPLRQMIGDARVIQLGEQTHGDGTTFLAKTRLIKFLHEEMGFDVLAFESGLYDCRIAWEQLAAGGESLASCQQGIFSIWTNSEEVRPLLDYLKERATSDFPLELCGVDCQFTGPPSAASLAQDLHAHVEKVEPSLLEESLFTLSLETIEHITSGRRPPEDEQGDYFDALDELADLLQDPELPEATSEKENQFWAQMVRSIRGYAPVAWTDPASRQGKPLASSFNPRDRQMGENLTWLAEEYYAGRKLIVWAATMHAIRNADAIDTGNSPLSYEGVLPMGHYLSDALGEEAFTVGFTTFHGSAGRAGGPSGPIPDAPAGSLESLCVQAGLENAVIPFRHQDAEWVHAPISSRPLGNSLMTASWPKVMDAMVFTKKMIPSSVRKPGASGR